MQEPFSFAAEIAKSITRELFFVQTQVLDDACAAMLHLTQSKRVGDYYRDRRTRLTDSHVELRPRRDKFLEVHLNRDLTSPVLRKRSQSVAKRIRPVSLE